ncbi:MAG: hypothetical protein JO117_02505 [Verrucomicrobia bacterium]|nr:hypothetical protein [Verrucomicrobiota bacterium]MBV9656743.1 hypothetical protein [Verrucomicrobiota bacterium]
MGLLRKLFWIALTLVFTFVFLVLFENGTTNFAENAQHEFDEIKTYFAAPPKKKPDTSDKLK